MLRNVTVSVISDDRWERVSFNVWEVGEWDSLKNEPMGAQIGKRSGVHRASMGPIVELYRIAFAIQNLCMPRRWWWRPVAVAELLSQSFNTTKTASLSLEIAQSWIDNDTTHKYVSTENELRESSPFELEKQWVGQQIWWYRCMLEWDSTAQVPISMCLVDGKEPNGRQGSLLPDGTTWYNWQKTPIIFSVFWRNVTEIDEK